MEKAETVIKDILLECLAQNANQPIEGVDSNTCIRYMNRFMDSMAAYGASLGYTRISSSSESVTIESGGMEGLIFNTAIRLCNSYDIPVSQSLFLSAKESKATMFMLARTQDKVQHPSTLPIGSGNEGQQTKGAYRKFYTPTESIGQEQFGTIQLETDTNDQEN